MTDYPHLPNAPLVEALFDIRVEGEIDLPSLSRFNEGIEDRFPVRREFHVFNVGWEQQASGNPRPIASSDTLLGYQYLSSGEDKPDKALQARVNGFNFSKLWGYDNWGVFSDEAKELYARYLSIASPEKVVRIALRYVNKIDIPWPFQQFSDYLKTVPEIASGIDKGLSAYLMRLQLPQSEKSAAIVTQLVEPFQPDSTIVPVIFDIDVFEDTNLSSESEEIWVICDRLRDIKNRIFFESITTKAQELFL